MQVERRLEFDAKPDCIDHWHTPRIIEMDTTAAVVVSYDFDIRSHCSYWLSLGAYNHNNHSLIANIVAVMDAGMSCQCLTIGFGKDNQNEDVAIARLAAVALLALFKRSCLRQHRLELQGRGWIKTKVLQHYGLTMQRAKYTIWCTPPILSDGQ